MIKQFVRINSLESRIVALFISLMLTLQIAAFIYINQAIDANARNAVHNELMVGERVFKRLLEQNAQKLTTGAKVLAADYAFRDAVASHNQETIASALKNHGERIGSAITVLIGLDHKIQAQATPSNSPDLERIAQQLSTLAEQKGTADDIAIIDGKPFQFVIVPIKAPITIGWAVMAFPINQTTVSDMKAVSAMDTTILTQAQNQAWQLNVSTFPNRAQKNLLTWSDQTIHKLNSSMTAEMNLEQKEFSAHVVTLVSNSQYQTIALLHRSVSDAVEEYQRLKITLLVLTFIGIVVAIFTSVFFARRLTGPLRDLAESAKELGRGHYNVLIKTQRKDEIGDLANAFAHMREDIALREEKISRLAYWDTLTQLPNRVQFLSILKTAIDESAKHQEQCYVLMMDLDRFKHVNDVMGHRFGDELLRQVGHRLCEELGTQHSKPARLGGDEFAIVLPRSTQAQAQHVANQILMALERPISIEDQTVDLSAGIGISAYPKDGQDPSTLLIHAEVAMYVAKISRNGAVEYSPEIDQSSQLSLSLLSELRHALDTQAFRLYAQPKISLNNNQVVAVEVLVRWIHPERGFIYPDQFIPFSEQTGFIRLLTLWVLEQAALACKNWIESGLQLKVSVNLSTRDLLDQDLPAKIETILNKYQVTPERFCLEITESAIMDDPIRAQQTLDKLSSMGFDLSIDDFGTGYSSLAYLKRLPVNELKIDKSFVLTMENDADDTKIVRSTIDLGHNMGLRVVAEGVENLKVMQLLAELGCDQAQGYFMSKPIPVDQIYAWIQTWDQEHALQATCAN